MSYTTQHKCPKCKTALRVTNLSQRLWCKKCWKYYEEEDVLSKKQLKIRKMRKELFGR